MSDLPVIRVFLTPNPEVLTLGVIEAEGIAIGEILMSPSGSGLAHGEGVGWHRFRGPAIRRAHAIRMAAIARHEAEIDALKALDFGASTGGFRG